MKIVSHRGFAGFIVCMLLLTSVPTSLYRVSAAPSAQSSPEPVTSHPRLILTAEDLPRLRGWASDSNPIWRDGILPLAERMRLDMDEGRVPGAEDGGRVPSYPTENYAAFFAFMSLLHPDPTTQQDYAERARTLLMYAMNEAIKGQAEGEPFRSSDFMGFSSDRARWWGESWALTVDWIYPMLSAEDKATIRDVFLRWSEEIITTGYRHPEPIGLINDPALFADKIMFRGAGNNYFSAEMRNVGMMALALDPADDPGGELDAYLKNVIGAHLYMIDELFRTDAAGGLAPEGYEYSPQMVAYVAQFLLALHTAGRNDPAMWGDHVRFENNPFWGQVIPAFLHSLSPQKVIIPELDSFGETYQPAWYGDGEIYWGPDMIALLGAMGRYDDLTGNQQRLDAIRWIQTETPPGGPETLVNDRVLNANVFSLMVAVYYFLLFDPAAPPPADPHDNLSLMHFAPGIGRLLARTSWDEDASWFTYGLGWITIDHQNADGNMFAFYRDGEWLTKGMVGYGGQYGDGDPSDDFYYPDSAHQNTLALENDPSYTTDPTDFKYQLWLRGSQWEYVPAGDPTILAMSVTPGYAYALGDATNLYNSVEEQSMDIVHASRSIVWLAPDTIVVYDRAESKTEGRFKRFWLNLLTDATVADKRTTMTTEGGNQLVIDTLLPTDATPEVRPSDNPVDTMATGEPMRYQFLVEAPGGPRETRFLHVLQGADADATVGATVALESSDGTFAGTVVGTTAVLFPVDLNAAVTDIQYIVPETTTTHLITGLTPGGGYDVVTNPGDDGIEVTVQPGNALVADDGGVLLVGNLPAIMDTIFGFTNTLTPIVQATDSPDATVETPVSDETPVSGEETGTATPGVVTVELPTAAAVEGGEAASGEGQIVFEAVDSESGNRHIWRVDATEGATPQDVTVALDALGSSMPDEWIAISPNGEWLLLGTERFNPECAGWPCLAVVPADLSAGETVLIDGAALHTDGFGAIAGTGDLIVYPASGGSNAQDLWAITREGDGWSSPVLLTADSPYAFNHTAAISADGTRIVFDCGDQPYADTGTAICEVGTDGANFRVVVTPDDAPSGVTPGGALHHPDYAPDGSIVFETRWTDTIWRIPAGGSEPEQVSSAYPSDGAPCVLADGRIATVWYGRPDNPGGQRELKVMTPDGEAYAMVVTGLDVEDVGCGG